MERLSIPGVAVAVRHGDEVEAAGFGVTSVENPLDVDADTLFQIGSITKTYTATAAMRLVEDGRLDLTRRSATCCRAPARRRGHRGARDDAPPARTHGRLARRLL
jgi:CubicO group peptidase (beta-lactamase class C family)